MSAAVAQAYADSLPLVGVVHHRDLGTLGRMDLERFDVATGLVTMPTEGLRTAHPLHLTAVLGWAAGPPNSALRPDGTEVLDTDAIPLAGLRLMGGGQDLELHADVVEGMTVRAEMELEGLEVKQGRTGDILLIHLLRRYLDEHDTLLVTCRETLMAR